jgi:hypothetical protein
MLKELLIKESKDTLDDIDFCFRNLSNQFQESVWILDDGDVRLSPIDFGNFREHSKIIEIINEVDTKFTKTKPSSIEIRHYFQQNAHAMRVRCNDTIQGLDEMRVLNIEFNVDQPLPTRAQWNTLEDEICEGGYDKIYYDFTKEGDLNDVAWKNDNPIYVEKDICDVSTNKLRQTFRVAKIADIETLEADYYGIPLEELIERRIESREILEFHVGKGKTDNETVI